MKTFNIISYRYLIFTLFTCALSYENVYSRTITLYLKEPPSNIVQSIKKKLQQPKKISSTTIAKKQLKNKYETILPKLSGFIAIYGGYIDYSDVNGNITFPLLHTESKLYLVITSEFKPINIHGNTFSHKEFIKNVPKEMYLFEKKEDEQKVPFWKVSKQEIPKDNKIPRLSITLLTKPKNIVVPIGDFIATDNQNLILPNVYVVGNNSNQQSLSNFLDIKRFFEQIERKEKTKDTTIQELIQNN